MLPLVWKVPSMDEVEVETSRVEVEWRVEDILQLFEDVCVHDPLPKARATHAVPASFTEMTVPSPRAA